LPLKQRATTSRTFLAEGLLKAAAKGERDREQMIDAALTGGGGLASLAKLNPRNYSQGLTERFWRLSATRVAPGSIGFTSGLLRVIGGPRKAYDPRSKALRPTFLMSVGQWGCPSKNVNSNATGLSPRS